MPCELFYDTSHLLKHPLKCVVMLVRVRHLWNKTTREVQFYLALLNQGMI
ncbi:COG5433: Transposase [Richelia intracellularis]|nr:COG5433: Transposase [Richelia intracellularis]